MVSLGVTSTSFAVLLQESLYSNPHTLSFLIVHFTFHFDVNYTGYYQNGTPEILFGIVCDQIMR